MPNEAGTKYRRSTKYKVLFPTLPSLSIQPGEVDLYQQHGSHDILEMKFIRVSKVWQTYLQTGTPVIFNWTQGGRKNSWIGYVTHVKSQDVVQERRELKVIASSATYLLKERASRTWTNKSVTDVASLIAKEFGFSFETEVSRRKFEQLSISGESYWEWLREQGNKIGYALTFRGTELLLKSMDSFLNDSTFNSPLLSITERFTSANTKAYDRTLDFFEVDKSDFNELNDNLFSKKNISGVNPFTSKTINKVSNPASPKDSSRAKVPRTLFSEFSTEVVRGTAFAKNTAIDSASNSTFSFLANARGQGDPRIMPLNSVNILGTGAETDGFWVVDSVHHSFNITGLYEVDMKLRTDGIGNNVDSPFRKAAFDSSNTINVERKILKDLKGNMSSTNRTSLNVKSSQLAELSQGFNSQNIRWKGN